MDLEKILDKIAIEEAPPGLVYQWKMNLIARREVITKRILWPYIVLPIALSGAYYYISVFKREWLKVVSNVFSQSYFHITALKNRMLQNISIAGLRGFIESARNSLSEILSTTSQIFNSGSFLTWSIVFSFAIAILSLVWYFFWVPEHERLYSRI